MGYPRALYHACAVAALAGLTGCKQPSEAEQRAAWGADQASANFNSLNVALSRIDDLERKVQEQERQISYLEDVADNHSQQLLLID